MADGVNVGANLHSALRRSEIKIRDLAAVLHLTDKAVWRQMHVANPRRATVKAYAEAMNTLLEARADPRRYSVESLWRGPEPLVNGDRVVSVPELIDQDVVGAVATEIIRRMLTPTEHNTVSLPVLSPSLSDDTLSDPIVEKLAVPIPVIGEDATDHNAFALRLGMYDDDMGGAGLRHGSLLLARRDVRPREADVVVAHVPGKLVARRWTNGMLISEPLHGHASIISQQEIISILGVVVYVWIRLR